MPQSVATRPAVIIVMGVCGCGKTSFGEALAARLGAGFIEGDRLHPAENVERMSRGLALTDEDRLPWLHAVAGAAAGMASGGRQAVVACSALKKAYRDILRGAAECVAFVHLAGPREVALQRVGGRSDHFMPTDLVDSQYATLESTVGETDVVELDFTADIEANLDDLRDVFQPLDATGGLSIPAED